MDPRAGEADARRLPRRALAGGFRAGDRRTRDSRGLSAPAPTRYAADRDNRTLPDVRGHFARWRMTRAARCREREPARIRARPSRRTHARASPAGGSTVRTVRRNPWPGRRLERPRLIIPVWFRCAYFRRAPSHRMLTAATLGSVILPCLAAINSATMLTAISCGVMAPISRPIGA